MRLFVIENVASIPTLSKVAAWSANFTVFLSPGIHVHVHVHILVAYRNKSNY